MYVLGFDFYCYRNRSFMLGLQYFKEVFAFLIFAFHTLFLVTYSGIYVPLITECFQLAIAIVILDGD